MLADSQGCRAGGILKGSLGMLLVMHKDEEPTSGPGKLPRVTRGQRPGEEGSLPCCPCTQGSGGAFFSHSLFFYLSAAFLSPCLSGPGCTTWFPCSNNSCCSDSSPNPVLMLMANDSQGKQKLHFRGKVIKSVYCLLYPLCRASGISSTDADTCLETHLLSLEPLQY